MKPLSLTALYGPQQAPEPSGMPKFNRSCAEVYESTNARVQLAAEGVSPSLHAALAHCTHRRLWERVQ